VTSARHHLSFRVKGTSWLDIETQAYDLVRDYLPPTKEVPPLRIRAEGNDIDISTPAGPNLLTTTFTAEVWCEL
jgi:hypothetical protein